MITTIIITYVIVVGIAWAIFAVGARGDGE